MYNEYVDFELEINGEDGDYTISVESSQGEARASFSWPGWTSGDPEDLADLLQTRLTDLQMAMLRSGKTFRSGNRADHLTAQEFGEALFNAVISNNVQVLYHASATDADRNQKGLRIQLRVNAPELALLPWEFMYDPLARKYMCLQHATPIVRYPELPTQPRQISPIDPPIRVLGMAISPRDLDELKIEREKELIEEALYELYDQKEIELTWIKDSSPRDLFRELNRGEWHIFHFIGHGVYDYARREGLLIFADRKNNSVRLPASDLAITLGQHRSLRLVVVNACEGAQADAGDIHSSVASALIGQNIPSVLAMQNDITDGAALEFTQAFYESLVWNWSVERAVTDARIAMKISHVDSLEWATPALYMRSSEGQLFIPTVVDDTTVFQEREQLDVLVIDENIDSSSLYQEEDEKRSDQELTEADRESDGHDDFDQDATFNITELRSALSKLYTDEPSIRRIVDDSGLDTSRLPINPNFSAINLWRNILTELKKNDQIDQLLDSVEDGYGNNKEFQDARNAYRQSISQPDSRPVQAPEPESEIAKLQIPPGMSAPLYYQLREVLAECGPVDDDLQLRRIFGDFRLLTWRRNLVKCPTASERVDFVIHYLHNRYNSNGQNALILFMEVFCEWLDSDDECYGKLHDVAANLEQELEIVDVVPTDHAEAVRPEGEPITQNENDSVGMESLPEERSKSDTLAQDHISKDGRADEDYYSEEIIDSAVDTGVEKTAESLAKEVESHSVDVPAIEEPPITSKEPPKVEEDASISREPSSVDPQIIAENESAVQESSPSSHESASVERPEGVQLQETLTFSKSPIEFSWILIPAGTFMQGSDLKQDPDASSDEQPQHELWLPDYQIAKFPVTNHQYYQFLRDTNFPVPITWQNGMFEAGTEERPVTSVSWQDAVRFCSWAKVRLASEAEWEKAARGPNVLLFPWGTERPSEYRCNFANLVGTVTPITKYPQGQSPYHLYDVVGNVWEWTMSIPRKYPYDPDDGREDMNSFDERRILRGGAYDCDITMLRCAYRRSELPKFYAPNIGFRVVCYAI